MTRPSLDLSDGNLIFPAFFNFILVYLWRLLLLQLLRAIAAILNGLKKVVLVALIENLALVLNITFFNKASFLGIFLNDFSSNT